MAELGPEIPTWLELIDHEAWHAKPDYNPDAPQIFREVFTFLRYAKDFAIEGNDPYFAAYRTLVPLFDVPLCLEQTMNRDYLLALVCVGDESSERAILYLQSAWGFADQLQDSLAQSRMSFLEGGLLHRPSHYTEAYQAYSDALYSFQEAQKAGRKGEPFFELDITMRLAWCSWELGQFTASLRHLEKAREIRAVSAPDSADEAASIAWLDAQLSRILGRTRRAFDLAVDAADLLFIYGRPINAGRSLIILAECALDLAEQLEATRVREALPEITSGKRWTPSELLSLARKTCRLAIELANAESDGIGSVMARITLRRTTRLTHRRGASSGIRTMEKLLQIAQHLGEVSLIGRAQIALADELLAAGQMTDAKTAYQYAIHYLEEYQLGGLAFWPRRTLDKL